MEEIAQSHADFCKAKIQVLNISEEVIFKAVAQGEDPPKIIAAETQ